MWWLYQPISPRFRQDLNDLVYLSVPEKFDAVVNDIKEATEKGAPVLVGTASIETSELVSKALKKAKIEHQVLNAKYHKKEASIVAAGRSSWRRHHCNQYGRSRQPILC